MNTPHAERPPEIGTAPERPARRHGRDPGAGVPFSRSPVTLDDLLSGLLWTKLLRSASLALNPGRLWLCSFLLVAVFALDTTWHALFGGREPGPLVACLADLRRPIADLVGALFPHVQAGAWVWTPDLGAAGKAMIDLFITVPQGMIVSPEGGLVSGLFAVVILVPVAVVLTAVCGGAVCRSVAVEFATGRSIPWTRALAFGLSRWGSLVGALIGPLAIVWTICLLLVAAGWLMTWPLLNILGALLFPFVLLASLAAALAMVAYVVGHMMLMPAVACDGADGFDAVQRAYAYAYGRPLRLVSYLAVLLLQGVVAFLLLASVIWLGMALAERLTGLSGTESPAGGAGGVWLDGAARRLVRFWNAIVRIVAASYALSLYFAGSTVLYLLMRKLNDDQDPRDLWMPGLVEGAAPLMPAPAGAAGAVNAAPTGAHTDPSDD
ncbi:MAG: hypothetical protein AB7K52_10760 [Phycisphaerales bacterium]